MLLFIFGQESFLAHQRLLELKKVFAQKYPKAQIDDFDCQEKNELTFLRNAIFTGGGLFSQQRMVIIRYPFSLSKTLCLQLENLLKEWAEKKDSKITVVVWEKEIKEKKSALFLFLKKATKVEEYLALKEAQIIKWIIEQTKKSSENKVIISQNVANQLMLLAQKNLWLIAIEIEKLIAFKGEGEISNQELNLLCQREIQAKIFDLVDAISTKNKARALELLALLRAHQANDFYIFSMLLFQFRNLLKVSQCYKEGVRLPQAIATRLGMHPFVAQKTLAQLNNFSWIKLKEIFLRAAQLDVQVKKGQQTMQEAVEYFIVAL